MRTRQANKLKTKPATALLFIGVWLLSAFLLNACMKGADDTCMFNNETPCIPAEEPHKQLSDYGLFKGDLNNLEPVEGLLPFDLNTPLFSDYAQKLRMIYIPVGEAAAYTENEVLSFPVGSVLVKSFFYYKDGQNPVAGRRLIETRLLIRREHGWTADTYAWNQEQTEALLHQTGKTARVEWIDERGINRKADYLIPAKNDCKSCHEENGSLVPLGPKIRNLNKEYSYPDGKQHQLIRWRQEGVLQDLPDAEEIPVVPVWNDSSTGTLNERARIYLDVNCGNCHNPAGFASYTSLFLNLEEERERNLGIYKMPVAFGSGILKYDIYPGEPDSSILI